MRIGWGCLIVMMQLILIIYLFIFFRATYCNGLGVCCFKTHVWGVPSPAFRGRVEEVKTCCAILKMKYGFIR